MYFIINLKLIVGKQKNMKFRPSERRPIPPKKPAPPRRKPGWADAAAAAAVGIGLAGGIHEAFDSDESEQPAIHEEPTDNARDLPPARPRPRESSGSVIQADGIPSLGSIDNRLTGEHLRRAMENTVFRDQVYDKISDELFAIDNGYAVTLRDSSGGVPVYDELIEITGPDGKRIGDLYPDEVSGELILQIDPKLIASLEQVTTIPWSNFVFYHPDDVVLAVQEVDNLQILVDNLEEAQKDLSAREAEGYTWGEATTDGLAADAPGTIEVGDVMERETDILTALEENEAINFDTGGGGVDTG